MSHALENYIAAAKAHDTVIGIIGLGYVGIPLATRCSEVGFPIIGFDVVQNRVDELNNGQSPIKHIPHDDIKAMVDRNFSATTDFSRVKDCDALIICVPTPLNATREPDLSFVVATMDSIAPYFRAGQLLSLESTTWPDPGNEHFNTRTIPKILGGHTTSCAKAGSALYSGFIDSVVEVTSTKAAEMVKLLENIHRSVNIGLVNEMKVICEEMGLDMFEIVDAAATKPFGFTPYYPGPGIGGHCIPIDPFYLTWKAREYGVQTKFIELAGEVNASMPDYVVNKTMLALNEKGVALSRAKVLVLGIAYKRDIDDMRESPSVFVMELLRDFGADVHYSDPDVPSFPKMREHNFDLSSVDVTAESLASYDAVLLLTDHSDFDYELIAKETSVLIDTRGKYRAQPQANIKRA